ncbi:MAG: hypothetical protein HKP62_05805 [Sulfurovum sp.]|nr:hypothetical protein [Sulfurovum sp.]NNJ45510.1 hypothetical protein [Sulfurovum sp.]
MENEFKKIIEDAKKSIEKIENNIEAHSKDFTDEVSEFWGDLKKHLSGVEGKLKDTYDNFEGQAELKGYLGMMEAHDRLDKLKETTYEFSYKVSKNVQEELDIATLKAHLAKMESEDIWEEKQKKLLALYNDSKEEAEKLAIKASKELNNIAFKLTEMI